MAISIPLAVVRRYVVKVIAISPRHTYGVGTSTNASITVSWSEGQQNGITLNYGLTMLSVGSAIPTTGPTAQELANLVSQLPHIVASDQLNIQLESVNPGVGGSTSLQVYALLLPREPESTPPPSR